MSRSTKATATPPTQPTKPNREDFGDSRRERRKWRNAIDQWLLETAIPPEQWPALRSLAQLYKARMDRIAAVFGGKEILGTYSKLDQEDASDYRIAAEAMAKKNQKANACQLVHLLHDAPPTSLILRVNEWARFNDDAAHDGVMVDAAAEWARTTADDLEAKAKLLRDGAARLLADREARPRKYHRLPTLTEFVGKHPELVAAPRGGKRGAA